MSAPVNSPIILAGITARAVYTSGLPLEPVTDAATCTAILRMARERSRDVDRLLAADPRLARAWETWRTAPGSSGQPCVLLGEESHRNDRASLAHHLIGCDLPAGSLWRLPPLGDERRGGDSWDGEGWEDGSGAVFGRGAREDLPDTHCVSPALHLLLRARTLGREQIALLAMELCGGYETALGQAGGLRHRPPLTTIDEIGCFLDGIHGRCTGVGRVRWARDRIMEGTLSPRESALALLLSIPAREGGYGLPRPELNRALDLPSEMRRLLPGQGQIRFDLLWEGAGVAVEYDSNSWHDNGSQLARDRARMMAARHMGIELVSITNAMVASVTAFEPVADSICRLVRGRGAWPVGTRVAARRKELHHALFQPVCLW